MDKEMKGGMMMRRQVGGAKHKKEMEACESDSEDEMAGAGEMPPLYAMKRKNFPMNRGAGASDGRKKRAEIVRKVMADRGVKMIEASKIVKREGLY
jgi:hypothetical protein